MTEKDREAAIKAAKDKIQQGKLLVAEGRRDLARAFSDASADVPTANE